MFLVVVIDEYDVVRVMYIPCRGQLLNCELHFLLLGHHCNTNKLLTHFLTHSLTHCKVIYKTL